MDIEHLIPESEIEKIEADIYLLEKQSQYPYLTINDMESMAELCQEYFTRLIDWLKEQISIGGDAGDYNSICIDYARDYSILNRIDENLYYGIQLKKDGE